MDGGRRGVRTAVDDVSECACRHVEVVNDVSGRPGGGRGVTCGESGMCNFFSPAPEKFHAVTSPTRSRPWTTHDGPHRPLGGDDDPRLRAP